MLVFQVQQKQQMKLIDRNIQTSHTSIEFPQISHAQLTTKIILIFDIWICCNCICLLADKLMTTNNTLNFSGKSIEIVDVDFKIWMALRDVTV